MLSCIANFLWCWPESSRFSSHLKAIERFIPSPWLSRWTTCYLGRSINIHRSGGDHGASSGGAVNLNSADVVGIHFEMPCRDHLPSTRASSNSLWSGAPGYPLTQWSTALQDWPDKHLSYMLTQFCSDLLAQKGKERKNTGNIWTCRWLFFSSISCTFSKELPDQISVIRYKV